MPRGTQIKCDWHRCGCKPENGNATFMWLDHTRKIFWYEVPRCASTSVRFALKNGLEPYGPDFCTPNTGQKYARGNEYAQFAIIRDPLERLRSAYSIFQYDWERCKGVFGVHPKDLSFEKFVSEIKEKSDHHFQPQTKFLPEDLSDVKLIRMTPVESLNAEWETLSLPRLQNRGSPRKASTTNDQVLKNEKLTKIFLDFYKDDFELLGFSKNYKD